MRSHIAKTTSNIVSVCFDYRGAERYTGASERFLRDEIVAGRLKSFKIGNRIRFHKDDLDAWLNLLRQEEAERQKNRNSGKPRKTH